MPLAASPPPLDSSALFSAFSSLPLLTSPPSLRLTSPPQGIAFVSTSANAEHVADNLLALTAPALTPEEMDAIRDDPKGEQGGPNRWPSVMRPCGTGP